MSVWKTAHYRDDALQWGLRNIGPAFRSNMFFLSLADFDVEDFGEFPVPAGLRSGNLKDQIREDINLADRLSVAESGEYNTAIGKLADGIGAVTCGLQAVLNLSGLILSRIADGDKDHEDEKVVKEEGQFFKTLLRYGLAASNHSAKDFEAREKEINEAAEGNVQEGEKWIKDLIRFRGYHRARGYQAECNRNSILKLAYPKIRDVDTGLFRGFDVYAFRGATLIKARIGTKAWLITSKDVDRIEHIVRGVTIGRVYGLFYGALQGDKRRRLLRGVDKMTNLMINTLMNCQKGDENYVCRAFDVGFHMYTAKHICKDDPRALREQKEKYRDEKLHLILDVGEYHRCVTGLPPKEAMEILFMYKCLPQPDFDYFGAAERQKKMYEENRKAADDDGAATGVIFENIMEYHKLTMIRSFFRRHGRCPGKIREGIGVKKWHNAYPQVDPRRLIPSDVNDIDFNGDFIWKERGIDNLDLVKDKAIIPKNIKDIDNIRDVRNTPVSYKNYLMDVLTRTVPMDVRTLASKFERDELGLDVRADDKAEAKKPNQRWFFELGSDARMLLSVYEDSITDYAIHTVGCFSGKTQAAKIDTMNNITKPVLPGVPFRCLNISFDIRKFSPYLPDRVHRALDEQWAEAFGIPVLKHMHKIITEGNIHYVKGPIHHVFKKVGADFEGFFGKKLTLYHCAVMGYAVRRLREKKIIQRPARFAALIDDGLLRIDLDSKKYESLKKVVLTDIELVYAKGALRISWDKTYVSEYYACFLHEVRFAGRSITAGMRAILKMTNKADEPVDSLVADLAVCSSTAYGAVTAGSTLFAAYVVYLLQVMIALKRWKDKTRELDKRTVIKAFFPLQYGGFGLESMITMSGSLKGPTIPEALSNLELIGHRYPSVRETVNDLLNAHMVSASRTSEIYNPGNMVVKSARLRGDRFSVKLEIAIANKIHSPVMKALIGANTSDNVGFVELALDSGAFIPQPLREMIRDTEKYEVVRKVAKKFLTARSALCFMKGRDMAVISIKNRNEAFRVLKYFTKVT